MEPLRTNGNHGGQGGALRVVIAGAGVAGLETLLALRHLADERVSIELVAPSSELRYWPLVVATPFEPALSENVSLQPLFERHDVRFHRGFLTSVDAAAHLVTLGDGDELSYDALVLACGATRAKAVPGALTIPSPGHEGEIEALLEDVVEGHVRRIAFALPPGAGWPLPLYELALMVSANLASRSRQPPELILVTPESDPLGLFGKVASEKIGELLADAGIELITQTYPVAFEPSGLVVRPGGLVAADRVIALGRPEGPRIHGIPQDADGFIPVTPECAVVGVGGVYAAGDASSFPVKQGGIATQQADAVAAAIAAAAGAPVTPHSFRPVLNGLLLTGGAPRYLRSELTVGYGTCSLVSLEPLWWPPAKIAGRYLGPALAELAGRPLPEEPTEAVEVKMELSGNGD
jgi:sulfide:quinone oxidoreductase